MIILLLIIATMGPQYVSGARFGALHKLHLSFGSHKLLFSRRGRHSPGTHSESWAEPGSQPRPA